MLGLKLSHNLFNFLDNLEKYLKEVNKTIEFKKKMEEIELVCHVEMNGSSTLKDLHVLVLQIILLAH